MGLVLFALKSLVRRGRRNLLATIILAFGLMIFLIGNALLDGGAAGLTVVYRDGLIGDAAIGYADEQPISIWGYEELFSTQFTKIPVLDQAHSLEAELATHPAIASICPLVASAALLEIGQFRNPVYLMGTDSARFFPSRKLHFQVGAAPVSDDKPWIVISSGLARSMGRQPAIGEKIQITYADDGGFVIRGLPLAGIVDFPVQNAALDSLCIVDIPSAWELLGLSNKDQSNSIVAPETISTNTDDLFSGDLSDQIDDENTKSWDGASIKKLLQGDPSALKRPKDGALQFLLLQFKQGESFDSFAQQFKTIESSSQARLMDWRLAAGQSLRYVVSIQRIFNGGMLLFSVLVVMIFINTLSNAIMERRAEIGVFRALGARRKKVSLIFAIEYVSIGFVSLLIAMVAAGLVVIAINKAGIHLDNEILVNLFGGATLRAEILPSLVLKGIGLSLALPLVVVLFLSGRLASVTPQQAMQNGS